MTSLNLYCDRDHSRLDIGRLVNQESLGPGWALEHPTSGHNGDLPKMTQVLDEAGRPVDVGLGGDVLFRRRYRLSCRECLARVVVNDAEPLWNTLTRLAENGVLDLRLTELAAACRYRAEQ